MIAPVECVAQHRTKVIDEAIDQWRARLTACVRAKGGHFEHLMQDRLELSVITVTTFCVSFELNMTLLRCCISTHLTFQVSQGSAATDLRRGKSFNKLLFHSSFLDIVVKKLRKPINICQRYRKNKSGTFFYGPQCRWLKAI